MEVLSLGHPMALRGRSPSPARPRCRAQSLPGAEEAHGDHIPSTVECRAREEGFGRQRDRARMEQTGLFSFNTIYGKWALLFHLG